jgi:hypothetical protein
MAKIKTYPSRKEGKKWKIWLTESTHSIMRDYLIDLMKKPPTES